MLSYKNAGVDIESGNVLVKKLRQFCPDIGGFNGLYPLDDNFLVASTDGVGTKLKLAFEMQKHETIGIDLVAMCVNDVITVGAKPLFLLDYFATSKLEVEKTEAVLRGVMEGCRAAGCALLGGETAEMPGFYNPEEYDIAGFTVGLVKKDHLIDGKNIQEGDFLVGIASSGFHSNGFSLIREVVKQSKLSLTESLDPFNVPLGDILLTPTRIYVTDIFEIIKSFKIKGMAHITGGGLTENVPRMLPDGFSPLINKESWRVPPLFHWLQEKGSIAEEEMFRTFNMGIGMVMALSPEEAKALCTLRNDCRIIGKVTRGDGAVLWG